MRAWLIALPLLAACAATTNVSAPFNTNWQNDAGRSIAEVERRLRSAPRPPTVPVVVGVTESALIGMPLAGGLRWTQPGRPDTLPAIAGGLVFYSAGGRVTALDALTGARRWSVSSAGYQLRGAGDDGQFSVLSLGHASERKSLLLAVRRDGSVSQRLETATELGRPAAVAGVAFVPWSGQYVSALDLDSGAEIGRLLTRELTSHALNVGGELFFGERGVLHFDEQIRFASTNQAERVALPERNLPGKPQWLLPGGELPRLDLGARQRIRIYAAPSWDGTQAGFASGTFVATYFRALLAFDTRTAELKWTRSASRSVVGGGAAASGFVLCTGDGKALRLAADGGDAGSVELGVELRACAVEASTLTLTPREALPALQAQIRRVLTELDPEMAAAQAFLVTELGRSDDPLVTKSLIELTTSPRLPPDARMRARELLARRRNGAEFMLAALDLPYDALRSDALPPPVGPIADALAAMRDKRAAPLLARHLNDPATLSQDVEHAARALTELATDAELSALRTFFALYRGTADEPSLVQAVVAVASAILRIGGVDGRALVERATRDPLTEPDVARALTSLMSASPSAARNAATASSSSAE